MSESRNGGTSQRPTTQFDIYVEGTKLKKLNKLGRMEYQETFDVSKLGLGQKSVRPDYSIYNEFDELVAIADAKTSNFIGFDDQAKGFLEIAAQQTKSRTIIYYTPTGTASISSEYLKAANQAGVRIIQVGVD